MMMSRKSIANAVGGKTARACDSCVRKRARWYCAADDAFLCQSCDSTVHSANPLARRHQRLRLNSSSSSTKPTSPPWLSGFTRKPRTPRPRPKSDLDALLSLVPEDDNDNDDNNNHDHHHDLLFRVPTSPSLHDSFFSSDLDFAADVDSLLGTNLESECFDLEGLGIGLGLGLGAAVKMEDHHHEQFQHQQQQPIIIPDNCNFRLIDNEFDADNNIDLMRDPLELNFSDYDHHEKLTLVGVKNERQCHHDYCAAVSAADEEEEPGLKTNKNRKLALRLDCDAVITAWGNDKSPWTTGQRPHFDPDEPWPHSLGTICGVSYGQTCGEYGMSTAAAMGDGGREARVSRYREKRRTRLFSKKIRYEVRKLNAEKRPRMKGRFVKRMPFAQPTLPVITIN